MFLKPNNKFILLIMLLCFMCKLNCDKSQPTEQNDLPPQNNNPLFDQIKLSDNLYFFNEHVSSTVNIVAFIGPTGHLLVDTGYLDACQALKNAVQKLGSSDISYIINTHYHDDHIGGNSIIDYGGEIIAHENCQIYFTQLDSATNLTLFEEEYSISFNNEEIKCYSMPFISHTNSDIAVYFTNSRVLCLGDIYLSESFPSVPSYVPGTGATVQNLLANLDSIVTKFPSDVIIVPGHGRSTTMEEFKSYIDLVKATADTVVYHQNLGESVQEIIDKNVLAKWSKWGTFFPTLTTDTWIKSIYYSYMLL
jgi:cyclase